MSVCISVEGGKSGNLHNKLGKERRKREDEYEKEEDGALKRGEPVCVCVCEGVRVC